MKEKQMRILKKIYKFFFQVFQTISKFIKNILVDSQIIPDDCPDLPFSKKVILTQRYKLAGFNLPISSNEKKLTKYRNTFYGKRCFILGNGPSLNKCDLRLLKNEVTFGVNSIFLNQKNMGYYPTFYVVEDVFVAEDRAAEINSLHGSIKFFGNYLTYCIDGDVDTIWLNVIFNYEAYPQFPKFSVNAARKVWVGGTVIYICLQLAYYMGFSSVILIGFDHSYNIPASAEIQGNRILSTEDDPNHFSPEYFGKGYRWHDPRVDRMEKSFFHANDYFSKNNRKIYNATVGGKLEIFDRIDYMSLF